LRSPAESETHNSILLEARNEFSDTQSAELSWNNYLSWNEGIRNYEIWLKIDDRPFEKIAENVTNRYIYSDSISGFDYCFAVKAIENGGNESYAWSNTGCVIFMPELFPYNVITPNDDRWNQSFVIRNIEFYPNSILSIYNRWGKKIEEFKDIGTPGRGPKMGRSFRIQRTITF